MKTILIAAVAATSLAGSVSASTLTDTFSSYYAFGDSLTDDGKYGVLGAPSLGGRFSNGRTYAEHIADEFEDAGLDNANFALGGATASDANLSPEVPAPLNTFSGQIGAFGAAVASGFAAIPGDNPLVSVLFGGNDFFQGQDMEAAADSVANGIRTIGAIASHTFDDFLVLSLPDIDGSPAFAGSAEAAQATEDFNTQLAMNIIDLRNEGFNIITYDTQSVTDEILADFDNGSPLHDVTNVTEPCTASMTAGGPSCVDLGLDPDTFLFSDAVHPNAVTHRLLGERAIAAVEATVPVPAALPLLLSAVVGFGIAANRRRRVA